MWRALVFIITAVLCAPVAAQSPDVELSESQRILLSQVDSAIEARNPALAQSLLQQVLDEQPVQSVFVRLAMLYAQEGRCTDAGEQLRAATAVAPDMAQEDFEAARQEVSAQLSARCARLEPKCTPEDLVLEIVEGEQISCSEAPFWVAAGKLMVVYDFYEVRRSTASVNLDAGQVVRPRLISRMGWRDAIIEARVELGAAIPVQEREQPSEATVEQTLEGPSVTTVAAWSMLGLGAVSMATGVAFAIELSSTNDDARALAASGRFNARDADRTLSDAQFFEAVQYSAYGLSAVLLTTGAVLLWLDSKDEEVALLPMVAPDVLGATWVLPWR